MKKIVFLICSLFCGAANATAITFDESAGVFSDGYGGLDWSGFGRVHTPTYFTQDTGYVRGNISPEYTAFTSSSSGAPATVSIASGTFDFTGAYITAAWQNDLTVYIDGLLSGSTLFSQVFTINDDAPIFTNSNFLGIDTLNIYTFSGVDAGTPGGGKHVAIDNFTINESVSVPEPASIALLGLGLAGIGFSRKKKTS